MAIGILGVFLEWGRLELISHEFLPICILPMLILERITFLLRIGFVSALTIISLGLLSHLWRFVKVFVLLSVRHILVDAGV